MNNNLDIKIAFFDIDGTLTNNNQEISNKTIETLKKAARKDIKIVLCSGRTNSYVCNFIEHIPEIRYAISSNGAEIYDLKTKQNIFENRMDFDEVKYLWEYSNINKFSIVLNTTYNRYANKFTVSQNSKIFVDDIDFLENENIFQVVIADFNYDNMKKLENKIKELKNTYIINFSHDYLNKKENGILWFDVLKNDINKGLAIKFLLNKLNISPENAICFGDSVNDIDMFKACGIKVAMGNALNKIKEMATYITDTNENNGISYFFDNYIFKK